MDKDEILDDIFSNDPLGLLIIKPNKSYVRTTDERLLASFQEINNFVETNGSEPKANVSNIAEFQLYARLKSLKEDETKVASLKEYDIHNLLPNIALNQINDEQGDYNKPKEINTIDDLLSDDFLDILGGDDEGLFDFKYTPKEYDRAQADFVARRKPCKDFDKYKQLLSSVQKDLKSGKRKLIHFKQQNLQEGAYYVHNGILFLLEKINITHKEYYKKDGTRVREDGRTRCVFENGTESNMLKRSVEKILYANGLVVTGNINKVNEDFIEKFNDITDEDEGDINGYIYVLQSKSKDYKIRSINNLFKIGYSTTKVEERIKNAEKEPTYLMAPVHLHRSWECYNMNTEKLEQLLHNFFGKSCLELDVFDEKGKRHIPREWFIAPIDIIEQAVDLIISGEVINYKYDAENFVIVDK